MYYANKHTTAGYLDVDANAGSGKTLEPVENIRFNAKAEEGIYKFYVHNYTDRNRQFNPYKVELEVNGEIYVYEGDA